MFLKEIRVSFVGILGRLAQGLDDFYIVWWAAVLLQVIVKNRTIIGDDYFISDKTIDWIIRKNENILPEYVKGKLTPHLLMKHLRFVPVGVNEEGILWKEPCLTKNCSGIRRDGSKCTYGHPVATPLPRENKVVVTKPAVMNKVVVTKPAVMKYGLVKQAAVPPPMDQNKWCFLLPPVKKDIKFHPLFFGTDRTWSW